MIYIKEFNNYSTIEQICKDCLIRNYTINKDGLMDVDGSVILDRNIYWGKIPIKFGYVSGLFHCSNMGLESLEGAPYETGYDFICGNNRLDFLQYAPKKVGGGFYCENSYLTSLVGSPEYVGESFFCIENQLTDLVGISKHVGGKIWCSRNKLTSLNGLGHLGEYNLINIDYERNPIFNIRKVFNTEEEFVLSLDYNYIRDSNIDRVRFKEALDELGLKIPEKIEGYNYI